MALVPSVRFVLIFAVVYALFEIGSVDAGLFRKRQLVVGRVGFRPGRSLAIGRGALLKPSGKRAMAETAPVTLAPTLDDILLPSFRATYCTSERQELADVLFANVVQAMQELRQFATICYGSEDPTEIRELLQRKPDDLFEYATEEL